MNRQPIASATLASAIGLALACVLFFGLSGCGGSSEPEPEPPIATGQSTAQAGDDRLGTTVLVYALPGPTVQLDTPMTVRVRLTGTLAQSTHYAATVQAGIALSQPVATFAGNVAPTAIDHTVDIALPAGRTALQALLTVRATDPATGLPTSALAHGSVAIDWEVTQP